MKNQYNFDDTKNPRNQHLLKAYDHQNDLEKGGEGSKGGKVIGHTKSGKPIYDTYSHPEHKHFTAQDHMDANTTHHDLSGPNDEQKKHWRRKNDLDAKTIDKPKSDGQKILESIDKQDKVEKSEQDNLEKGGKRAVIGEKREFSGRTYIKTQDGWKFFGKGNGAKAQGHHESSNSVTKTEDKTSDDNELERTKKAITILTTPEHTASLKTNAQRIANNRSLKALMERKQSLEKQSTAQSAGISQQEFDKLHPGTKKELEDNAKKDSLKSILELSQEERSLIINDIAKRQIDKYPTGRSIPGVDYFTHDNLKNTTFSEIQGFDKNKTEDNNKQTQQWIVDVDKEKSKLKKKVSK